MNPFKYLNLLLSILFVFNIDLPFMIAGNTYYVSPIGDDRNNGSVRAPWKTIPHALANTSPGDTIMLRKGTYTGSGRLTIGGIGPGQGGAPGKMLTIRNYPGEAATLNGAFLALGADYLRIQGLRFIGPSAQLWNFQGDLPEHIEIVNNYFAPGEDAPPWGILHFPGRNILIEGNVFEDLGGERTAIDHVIYITGGTPAPQNIIIRNNYINSPSAFGISVYTHGVLAKNVLIEGNFIKKGYHKGGVYIDIVESVIIRNNIIYDSERNGINIVGGKDAEIYNNTIVRTGGQTKLGKLYGAGINLRDVAGKNSVHNNIIYEPGTLHIIADPGTFVSHNLYWPGPPRLKGVTDSHPIVSDPLFEDTVKGDFRLQPSSPAIDAGIDIGLPFTGAGPDCGAYEFGLVANLLKPSRRLNEF